MGRKALVAVDPDLQDLAAAYKYCKIFHCSLAEYESRPYYETMWMLQIDATYNDAVSEMNG